MTFDPDVRSARDAWVLPGGVGAVCDVLVVDRAEPHPIDLAVGTLVHEYEVRDKAEVRNVARLRIEGASDARGFALVTPRGADVVEHRVIAGASPTAVPGRVAVLQLSWQTVGDTSTDAHGATVDAVLRGWRLGPERPVDGQDTGTSTTAP